MYEYIATNIKNIIDRTSSAAIRSGRVLNDIKIVAVTKTRTTEEINIALNAGLNIVGENKVQELCNKFDDINKNVSTQFHFIGHLQSNKVKYIVDKVSMIHSVDSYKLAFEIDKECKKIAKIMKVLIEVNIGDEQSKNGITADEIANLLEKLRSLSNIQVVGFMTIPPICQNPEDTRAYFRLMNKIFIDNKAKNGDNISIEYLSMGMSSDFEIAIEEGANMIRPGTALFGERNYQQKV